jgi:ribonuclease-3
MWWKTPHDTLIACISGPSSHRHNSIVIDVTKKTLHPARIKELQRLGLKLGHSFSDLDLLDRALCHSSTGNEGRASYERLEFLGDAVLGFIVADHLFREEPDIEEGQLSDARAAIVSRNPLASVADRLSLNDFLIGGRSLRDKDRSSKRILADLTESVLGAIYLDGGIRAARKFVRQHIIDRTQDLGSPRSSPRDPKSKLQHLTQVCFHTKPLYQLLATEGPDHDPMFEIAVIISDEKIAIGRGATKQAAEKQAAHKALANLQQKLSTGECTAESPEDLELSDDRNTEKEA